MKLKNKEVPRLSSLLLNDIVMEYYNTLKNAKKENKKVCWMNAGLPAGILYAFEGMIPFFPQMHGELHAVRGNYEKMANFLEGKWEVPREICGEAKATLGLILYGNDDLSFHSPNPDLLLTTNEACMQIVQVFKVINEHLSIPHYDIDIPPVFDGSQNDFNTEFVTTQILDQCDRIEKELQIPFNTDRLIEYTKYCFKIFLIWEETLKLFKYSPVPMDSLELLPFFNPIVFADFSRSGEKVLNMYLTFYGELYERIKENEKNKTPKETFRILWDIQPILGKKKFIKNLLSNYNASIVMLTFLESGLSISGTEDSILTYPITEAQIEKIAYKTLCEWAGIDSIEKLNKENIIKVFSKFISGNVEYKRNLDYHYERMRQTIDRFNIDAIIFNTNQACRVISATQRQVMNYIRDNYDIPILTLDVNPMDNRYFSSGQLKTRIEAFMESIE